MIHHARLSFLSTVQVLCVLWSVLPLIFNQGMFVVLEIRGSTLWRIWGGHPGGGFVCWLHLDSGSVSRATQNFADDKMIVLYCAVFIVSLCAARHRSLIHKAHTSSAVPLSQTFLPGGCSDFPRGLHTPHRSAVNHPGLLSAQWPGRRNTHPLAHAERPRS